MNDRGRIMRRIMAGGLACTAALAIGCAGAGTTTSAARSGEIMTEPPRPPRLAPIAEPRTSVYDCGEGLRFTAYFHADTAELILPDSTVILWASMTPAGTRYINGNTSLWINRDGTFLTIGGATYRNCRETEMIRGSR